MSTVAGEPQTGIDPAAAAQVERATGITRPNPAGEWSNPNRSRGFESPTGTALYTRAVRALIQRTTRASVTIDNEITAEIANGLVILLGVTHTDTAPKAHRLAERVARLRAFPNAAGRFDKSLLDTKGEALVVSQFTLYGDTTEGNRPSMSAAAPPDQAEPLYERFIEALRDLGITKVETGTFGASMQIELVNDGPVTLLLEG
jgi:D-tyrosyl-tRNA(Tyr) deacylase